MTDKVTLILILHNRHKNLDRLLEYYKDYNFPIIIADSSEKKHVFNKKRENWIHHYSPSLSFTQKIEVVSKIVTTPYVVMCADDDFILPESLQQCVLFLEQNKDYSIAQGWSIRYYKESIATGSVSYGLLYDFSESIEATEPLDRLLAMFQNYRSVLYAVFRTETLQQSFEGAGTQIKNLFLNEYITAFIPILYGKYKELPVLYQVREFAEDSDDKTAINLDTILDNTAYKTELWDFKSFLLTKLTTITNLTTDKAEQLLDEILISFSAQLKDNCNQQVSFKKKVGKLISFIPFIGKTIIIKSRQKERAKQLQTVVKSQSDKGELERISKLLIKFQ